MSVWAAGWFAFGVIVGRVLSALWAWHRERVRGESGGVATTPFVGAEPSIEPRASRRSQAEANAICRAVLHELGRVDTATLGEIHAAIGGCQRSHVACALRRLKRERGVVQEGSRRGARYRLAPSSDERPAGQLPFVD